MRLSGRHRAHLEPGLLLRGRRGQECRQNEHRSSNTSGGTNNQKERPKKKKRMEDKASSCLGSYRGLAMVTSAYGSWVATPKKSAWRTARSSCPARLSASILAAKI